MTKDFSNSLVIKPHKKIVILSFEYFPPAQLSPFKVRDLHGKAL